MSELHFVTCVIPAVFQAVGVPQFIFDFFTRQSMSGLSTNINNRETPDYTTDIPCQIASPSLPPYKKHLSKRFNLFLTFLCPQKSFIFQTLGLYKNNIYIAPII